MEHIGLFRIIVLVYLMDCSHVGLFKIIALEICQMENIPLLTMHSRRQARPWWQWRWAMGRSRFCVETGRVVRWTDVLSSENGDGMHREGLMKL